MQRLRGQSKAWTGSGWPARPTARRPAGRRPASAAGASRRGTRGRRTRRGRAAGSFIRADTRRGRPADGKGAAMVGREDEALLQSDDGWRGGRHLARMARPGAGGSGRRGSRAARRSAHAGKGCHPGHLDVAEGAHDLDLEVREGGDDLPFAAAAGEGAHAFDAEVLEGGHDLDLDVGKGVDDLDLPRSGMPLYVQLALSGRRPAPGRARRAGRGRGGSAFFHGAGMVARGPQPFKPSRRASLCRLLGSTSSTRPRPSCRPACSASRTCWR